MGKVVYYRQCRLRKPTAGGEAVQVSWIPDRFAVADRAVRLRADDGTWDGGWVVSEVGRTRLSGDDLPDAHDLIRGHRRATGDAATRAKQ